MVRDQISGKLSLPVADHVGSADEPKSLIGQLAKNGIDIVMPFICAVYEDTQSKTHNVVYRGNAKTIDQGQVRDYQLIPLDSIPWKDLVDTALTMLLRRYIEEIARDAFGVYVGDMEQGEVHTIGASQ